MKKIKNAYQWALHIIALSAAILSLGSIAHAQHIPTEKLNELLDSLSSQNKAMGSLAISKDGEVIYRNALGFRFIQDNEKIPADINTKYRIASITKIFTSTMIFQLIEEGRIALNTPLERFFPTIPNSKKITIQHMLSHKSGIHDFTQTEGNPEWIDKIQTVDQMTNIISNFTPDFLPGDKFLYSNSNYVLLGFIIEKIDKKPYSECLKKRIIDKADLKNTFFGHGKPDRNNNESFSYKYNNEDWEHVPEVDLGRPAGAGGIISTPADLVKFIDALFALKLMSQTSLNQMTPLGDDHYGMGMHTIPYYEVKGIGHSGAIDASRSLLIYFPDESLSVAYCTNGEVYQMEEIINLVLKIYHHKAYKIPAQKHSIELDETVLKKYVGLYDMDQKFQISITLENGKLMAQVIDGEKLELFAKTSNRFFGKVDEVEVEFITSKLSQVDALMIINGEKEMRAKKLE